MSQALKFASTGAGAPAGPTYVDDVFSTYIYTGNGSSQAISNGVDLAGFGGLVWVKGRSGTGRNNRLHDTVRGANFYLETNTTEASTDNSGSGVSAFNSGGFSLSNGSSYNTNAEFYASWTFRRAARFLDIVTWTGNGSNRTISHALGVAPGLILVKRTDIASDWQVYHRRISAGNYLVLNSNAAQAAGATRWNSTAANSADFSIGTDASVNASGGAYIAYVFANDPGANGMIKCDDFVTDGAGGAAIEVDWEVQFILVKSLASGDWFIADVIRGATRGYFATLLRANTNAVESSLAATAAIGTEPRYITFSGAASTNYVYMTIRRPNKPPADGSQVFQPVVYTGTNVDNRLVNTGILTDAVFVRERNDTTPLGMMVCERNRGLNRSATGSTAAEVVDADSFMTPNFGGHAFAAMNGFGVGNDVTAKLNSDTTTNNHIALAFKRAPGFFDCGFTYGYGSAALVNHSLGVTPQLIIRKCSTSANNWYVYFSSLGNNQVLFLNTSAAAATDVNAWNSQNPSPTDYVIGTGNNSISATSYTHYLFATLEGISKVGSYTGNGSSQTVDCGFTTGARFVLIKRTDSTGDWYVWDTARGIVSGNDPHLSLNSTAAEVTGNDSLDPATSGFIVNQNATTNINVNGASYVYLAIA